LPGLQPRFFFVDGRTEDRHEMKVEISKRAPRRPFDGTPSGEPLNGL